MDNINIKLSVNGRDHNVNIEPNARLLDVIRDQLGFTGTKEGCGVGECGTCTVILNGRKVNSCMVLAAQADGSKILTIEGIASDNGSLHPIQEAFIEAGAVQCGFCTPGMVLSAYELLSHNPSPSRDEVKIAISGNLCRCTGYKQIVEAVELAVGKMKERKGDQR